VVPRRFSRSLLVFLSRRTEARSEEEEEEVEEEEEEKRVVVTGERRCKRAELSISITATTSIRKANIFPCWARVTGVDFENCSDHVGTRQNSALDTTTRTE